MKERGENQQLQRTNDSEDEGNASGEASDDGSRPGTPPERVIEPVEYVKMI